MVHRGLLLLMTFFVLSAMSKTDTTEYIIGECKHSTLEKKLTGQDSIPFLITFQNDSIVIKGVTKTNCCGMHQVIIDFNPNNEIALTQLQTGTYCFCNCPYDFLLRIPDCHAETYQIILNCFRGGLLDTIRINRTPVAIQGNHLHKFSKSVNDLSYLQTNEQVYDFHGRLISERNILRSPGIYIQKRSVSKFLFIK